MLLMYNCFEILKKEHNIGFNINGAAVGRVLRRLM